MHHQCKTNKPPLGLPLRLHFKTTHTDIVECSCISPINPDFWFSCNASRWKIPSPHGMSLNVHQTYIRAILLEEKKNEYGHCLAEGQWEREKRANNVGVVLAQISRFTMWGFIFFPHQAKSALGYYCWPLGALAGGGKAFNPTIISRLCTSPLNSAHKQSLCSLYIRILTRRGHFFDTATFLLWCSTRILCSFTAENFTLQGHWSHGFHTTEREAHVSSVWRNKRKHPCSAWS